MKRTPFKPRIKPLAGILRTANLSEGKPTLAAKPKMRKCAICKTPFAVRSMTHKACGPDCAAAVAKQVREKKERKELKARKEAIKSRGELTEEAQRAFNAWVRARDAKAGHPCICCGKPFEPQKFGGSIDAGHYRSRGSAPHLRFDPRNVHAQRKNCNRPGGTTHASFRAGMEARIGLQALEALEADQTPRHWTDDDLRAIKTTYKAKLRELLAGRD